MKSRRNAFTLLELLVVVAILAIIAGSLIVAYDGLEEKAATGVATYNIGALDSALRTFSVVNGDYGSNYDSLLYTSTGDGTDSVDVEILPEELKEKVGPYTLTADGVAALNEAGITQLRYITGSNPTNFAIPQRIFDNPTRGLGLSVPLTTGVVVAAVAGLNQPGFDSAPSDSSRLRDIANLDQTRQHVVVAVGIGNNASIIKNQVQQGGGLSEAPLYGKVNKAEYNRFIALFHLASDLDGSGSIDAGSIEDGGEFFEKARFLGVIDTNGDWYDEEYAEYTGQKP